MMYKNMWSLLLITAEFLPSVIWYYTPEAKRKFRALAVTGLEKWPVDATRPRTLYCA
jgi:hypothetical protein